MTLVRRRVRKKERDCALDVKLHVRLSLKSHSFVVSLPRFLSLTHPPRQVLQADTVLSLSLFFALTKTMYKHTRMANSLSLYHTHTFPQAYSFSLPFLSQTNKNMSLSPSFSSCLSLSLSTTSIAKQRFLFLSFSPTQSFFVATQTLTRFVLGEKRSPIKSLINYLIRCTIKQSSREDVIDLRIDFYRGKFSN